MNKLNHRLYILGAIAVAGGLASQAKADISYAISDVSLECVTVQYGANEYNVLAGGIGITPSGSSSTYATVCTDFGGSLYIGSSYNYASPISTASVVGSGYTPTLAWGVNSSAAIQNAATLFAAYSSVLNSGNYDAAAGLQMAVWTVLYDSTGIDALTTSNPEFKAIKTTSDAGAFNDMTADLNALTAGSLATATTVDSLLPTPAGSPQGNPDGQQPQSLLVYAPVPEASTVVTATLLLLSFGMCSLKSFGKFRA